MSRRQKQKDLNILSTVPLKSRHQRWMAKEVEVRFPPIRWTPELIADVAELLGYALARDLKDRPPRETKRAS